jgi:hypothetical protein
VLFKQVAEAEDRGLIRRGDRASIYSEEAAQHARLIERLFRAGVRQAVRFLDPSLPGQAYIFRIQDRIES